MENVVKESLQASIRVKERILADGVDPLIRAAELIITVLENGGKILLCGNGGSAADSQHIAAEFIGRFQKERQALPAIALTTDTSILTALGNDYGYKEVFARQVEGLGRAGDVLVAISTSGKSDNVLNAVKKARELGLKTVSLTGCGGGPLAGATDINLDVPSDNTARIQEAHICLAHILCDLAEQRLSKT